MTILHVGFPKAASSTLQYDVFPNLPGYQYFNPMNYVGHSDIDADSANAAILRLMDEGNETWDAAAIRHMFDATAARGKEVIVSSEGFTGYDGNIGLRAERALAAFSSAGNPKVLFVLRNQFDTMRSFYKQNGAKSHLVPDAFDHIEWRKWLWYHMLPGHRHSQILSMLRYKDIIAYYEKLFGRDAIHVLVYEQLRDDPSAFALALGNVFGADAETLQGLLSKPPRNAGPAKAKRRFLPFIPATALSVRSQMDFGAYEDELRGLLAPGNRTLAERYGLPLERLGYPV